MWCDPGAERGFRQRADDPIDDLAVAHDDHRRDAHRVVPDREALVVVDLWAPWCGPCRIVGPILEDLAREYAGRLKVVKVNVDENQGLAVRFDAMSIPTMIVMRDGQVVDRIVGALPKPALSARITPHIKPPKSATPA
jgi:thioredoxin 1